MADREGAKARPDRNVTVDLSPSALRNRITDPATIVIALIAAVLSFAGATVLITKTPVASGLIFLERPSSSRFLIDAYPMPGRDAPPYGHAMTWFLGAGMMSRKSVW